MTKLTNNNMNTIARKALKTYIAAKIQTLRNKGYTVYDQTATSTTAISQAVDYNFRLHVMLKLGSSLSFLDDAISKVVSMQPVGDSQGDGYYKTSVFFKLLEPEVEEEPVTQGALSSDVPAFAHHNANTAARERQLLPKMVAVSNNSRLTQDVCKAMAGLLSDKQYNDLLKWLNLVDRV